MSHPPAAQRNLTLTEELEKLEQSITLTLQEIDSNFNRAHRIVTSSIIPIVEQYAENSKDVWEASKFWKQFFEASANVSLSGYEEPPSETGQDTTMNADSATTYDSTYQEVSESYNSPSSEHIDLGLKIKEEDDPDLSTLSLSPSHSTPRAKGLSSNADDDSSPQIEYSPAPDRHDENSPVIESPLQLHEPGPRTPGNRKQHNFNDITTPNTSSSTVLNPISNFSLALAQSGERTDPIMHHVLDKTYRIQATPLQSSRKSTFGKGAKSFNTITPLTSRYKVDDSPLSSPELEAPKLHAELFDSPMIRKSALKRNSSKTRTPGISIMATPSKKDKEKRALWDSDEEGDRDRYVDDGEDTTSVDFSPPKTMQFHVPQSRLMKTPAKEASRRIVSDLLHTAGGSDLTDDLDEMFYDKESANNSPSFVRRSGSDDETF